MGGGTAATENSGCKKERQGGEKLHLSKAYNFMKSISCDDSDFHLPRCLDFKEQCLPFKS